MATQSVQIDANQATIFYRERWAIVSGLAVMLELAGEKRVTLRQCASALWPAFDDPFCGHAQSTKLSAFDTLRIIRSMLITGIAIGAGTK